VEPRRNVEQIDFCKTSRFRERVWSPEEREARKSMKEKSTFMFAVLEKNSSCVDDRVEKKAIFERFRKGGRASHTKKPKMGVAARSATAPKKGLGRSCWNHPE